MKFRTLIIISLILPFSQNVFAFGPAMTKRERQKTEPIRESRPSQASSDDYEKIYNSFLDKDYRRTDELAGAYLTNPRNQAQRQDVLYLDAMSLLKLGQAAQARERLDDLAHSSASQDVKADAAALIGELTLKKPASTSAPLRQMAFEEQPFFAVQVGSFSKHKNAEELVWKLGQLHYEAYVEKNRPDRMYRVRVGHFASKEEALNAETRLKKQGYPTKLYP